MQVIKMNGLRQIVKYKWPNPYTPVLEEQVSSLPIPQLLSRRHLIIWIIPPYTTLVTIV